ncbi:MAG: NAD-dependent epimerase/dehydratase family protein, partial [Bacteroidia bacterium]
METKRKAIITGASGFLGGRTVRFMAGYLTNNQIVSTSRRAFRKQELEEMGSTFHTGDLADQSFCESLTVNTEIIIHCAALSSPWGNYDEFYRSNFSATKTLLDSAIKNGVKKFIYISTPSIYFNYSDRYNVREADPLPEKMVNHYAATKLLAEDYVLSKNGAEISTIALRPRAIIGAEDTVILPRVLNAFDQGKLKIVGNGTNICDMTTARNVIEAMVCALNANENAFGHSYNITNGEPAKIWESLNYMLRQLGRTPVTSKVPRRVADWAARFMEWKARVFHPAKEPALTR